MHEARHRNFRCNPRYPAYCETGRPNLRRTCGLGTELDRGEVVGTFIQKTIFIRNPFALKSILKDATPLEFIRSTWAVSVICAQKFSMDVEDAIATFVADLDQLFAGYSDNGYAQLVYFPAAQRAIIMKAGREQTLLRVRYKGSERLVEPYSLKYMQKRCQRRSKIRPLGGAKPGQWRGSKRHGTRARHIAGGAKTPWPAGPKLRGVDQELASVFRARLWPSR